jgi:DNA-directed RNA polymerase subunit RPC12/RpoP
MFYGINNLTNSTGTPSADKDHRADIRELQTQVDRLSLLTEALWRLLQEKTGITEEELVRKVYEVDMEDGKLDGKKAKNKLPLNCPKCGLKTPARRPTCIYCGAPILIKPFE